jgi:hypothetical protein
MKAISVRQPWAWCILNIGKDIENRDWPTRVRGRVLIHASKGMTRDEWDDCLATCHHVSDARPFPPDTVLPGPAELVRGALLGSVEVVDCVTRSSSPWFFGDYGFVLRDPRPLAKPVPYKGALGFFDVPDEIVRAALEAV